MNVSFFGSAGYLIIAAVILVVGGFSIRSAFLLWKAHKLLQSDRLALDAARTILKDVVSKAKSGTSPAQVVRDLADLPAESAIGKRVRTLVTHQVKNALSPLDRVALIETESARQQAGTDEVRFWAGAFTFIGLIGTLLGLSFAVWHLISIIGKAGDSAAYSSSLAEITRSMTETFQGMGGAFFSTFFGVLASLVLSWFISRQEHAVETFRLEFEEFSHLELEPFIARAQVLTKLGTDGADLVAGGAWENLDELAPVKALVARLETISASFAETIGSAANSFGALGNATNATSDGLISAASVFESTVSRFENTVGPLNDRLEAIMRVVEDQKRVQETFLNDAQVSMEKLRASTDAATSVFEKLGNFEAVLNSENTRTRDLLQAHLDQLEKSLTTRLEALGTRLGALDNTLAKGSETLREDLNLLANALGAQSKELRDTLSGLPAKIAQNGDLIAAQISQGNQNHVQVLANLTTLVNHLANYVNGVDEAISHHAAIAHAGPLVEFDARSLEATRQLSETISNLRGELNGLRGAFGEAGKTVNQLAAKLDTQHDSLGTMANNVTQEFQSMQSRLATLDAKLEGVQGSWLYSVDRLFKRS